MGTKINVLGPKMSFSPYLRSAMVRFKQVFIEKKKLEGIDLSVTNETFVTKGEFKNNFLTTPTKEPKLNHWVNPTLNQFVI